MQFQILKLVNVIKKRKLNQALSRFFKYSPSKLYTNIVKLFKNSILSPVNTLNN